MRINTAAILLVSFVFFRCTHELIQSELINMESLKISNFYAEYNDSAKVIILKWTPPINGKFASYKIYRTNQKDENGGPDTNTFFSTENRSFIAKENSTFIDLPGLTNGTYFYRICAISDSGVAGEFASCSCTIGFESSFYINDLSASQTVLRNCTLKVSNLNGDIDSVKITQFYRTKLVKLDILGNVVDSVFIAAKNNANKLTNSELDSLIKSKWLLVNGQLAKGVQFMESPDFDAHDLDNQSKTYTLTKGNLNSIPWILSEGNGIKRVWVKFYSNGKVTKIVSKDIKIAAYRIGVVIRNRYNDYNARVLNTNYKMNRNGRKFYFFEPKIDFSVITFGDPTFKEEFYYWIVTSDSSNQLLYNFSTDSKAWLETVPRKGKLTSAIGEHDDKKVYSYNFDTNSMEGLENLSYLTLTKKSPQAKNIAFPLAGELPNQYAVPGSYWGEQPRFLDINNGKLLDVKYTVKNTPQINYRRIVNLGSDLANYGNKQFGLVLLLKGKHFNDTRTVLVSYEGSQRDTLFYDIYPPRVNFIPGDNDPSIISDQSKISNKFDVKLESISDVGGAHVDSSWLIIAKQSSNYIWPNYTFYKDSTLSLMLSVPHKILPYSKVRERTWRNVIWQDIDPSNWETGKYLMAVVTMDCYGNRGLAPASGTGKNPWLVDIIGEK